MSVATTTVFLYEGFNSARLHTPEQAWPTNTEGFLGLLDWLELMAITLERQYVEEFSLLDLPVPFDFEVTGKLGGWLYLHPLADPSDMSREASRIVAAHMGEAEVPKEIP